MHSDAVIETGKDVWVYGRDLNRRRAGREDTAIEKKACVDALRREHQRRVNASPNTMEARVRSALAKNVVRASVRLAAPVTNEVDELRRELEDKVNAINGLLAHVHSRAATIPSERLVSIIAAAKTATQQFLHGPVSLDTAVLPEDDADTSACQRVEVTVNSSVPLTIDAAIDLEFVIHEAIMAAASPEERKALSVRVLIVPEPAITA